MDFYELKPKEQETWTRGQIFRTAIIFIEIVVLLAAVLLNSITGSDTSDTTPMPQTVVHSAIQSVPTTIYVTSGFRVFVVQNSVHRLVGTLAECSNRYLDTDFDGALISDSFALYRRDIVHMATFLTDTYEITGNRSEVTLHLDNGHSYTVALHCNGELGMDMYNSQTIHTSTGLEDLVSAAQRQTHSTYDAFDYQELEYAYDYFDYRHLEPVQAVSETRASYDYGSGYGCQGDHH